MARRLALVAVLVLAACSSKKSAGAGSGSSEPPPVAGSGSGSGSAPLDAAAILAKLESFRDIACACTDITCVQTNEREMRNWLLREGPATMNLKTTPEQMAAAEKVTAAMSVCVERILHPKL